MDTCSLNTCDRHCGQAKKPATPKDHNSASRQEQLTEEGAVNDMMKVGKTVRVKEPCLLVSLLEKTFECWDNSEPLGSSIPCQQGGSPVLFLLLHFSDCC